jgi:4-hydroxybenzoyl-CoA thioesterase/acyl-CoA thioester hydrolase
MPEVFRTTRRVEFCETDAAGIAHFSSFFLYMEQAEHAFLRSVGLSVSSDLPGAAPHAAPVHISWPRVKAECEFKSPVKFESLLDIAVRIARMGEKSVTYAFEITENGRPVASGRMISVCCAVAPGQPACAMPIPAFIRERLAPFVFGG